MNVPIFDSLYSRVGKITINQSSCINCRVILYKTTGWWLSHPSEENMKVSLLGWWESQLNGKIKIFQTTNQIPYVWWLNPLPSGNQTWQWKIPAFSCFFSDPFQRPLSSPCFPSHVGWHRWVPLPGEKKAFSSWYNCTSMALWAPSTWGQQSHTPALEERELDVGWFCREHCFFCFLTIT